MVGLVGFDRFPIEIVNLFVFGWYFECHGFVGIDLLRFGEGNSSWFRPAISTDCPGNHTEEEGDGAGEKLEKQSKRYTMMLMLIMIHDVNAIYLIVNLLQLR